MGDIRKSDERARPTEYESNDIAVPGPAPESAGGVQLTRKYIDATNFPLSTADMVGLEGTSIATDPAEPSGVPAPADVTA